MKSLTAKDLMQENVLSVAASTSVYRLATFFTDREISGAPVEDEDGVLVGVVSLTDIVRSASEGGERSKEGPVRHFFVGEDEERIDFDELAELHLEDETLKVSDIMTPAVFTVDGDTPVAKVAEAMIKGHVHRLLVTSENRMVGIVSTYDLLRLLQDV